MAGLITAGQSAITDAFCIWLGGAANFEAATNQANENLAPFLPTFNPIASGYALLCSPETPEPPGGFGGGQCEGEVYRVTLRLAYEGDFPSAPQTFDIFRTGKLEWLGWGEDQVGTVGYVLSHTSGAVRETVIPDTSFYILDRGRSGLVGWQREDGQPDNCGGNPPDPEPGWNEIPVPITYVNNEGATVTIPVIAVFAPVRINANADIVIPVTITADVDATIPVNLEAEVNLSTGGVSFNTTIGGGSSGGDPPQVDDGDPENPIPPPPDGATPPDPPAEEPPPPPVATRRLYGCLVTVNTSSGDIFPTVIDQSGNPDILAPAGAYVNFYYKLGGSGGWGADIPIKNRRQVCIAETELNPSDVRGTASPGCQISVAKIYRVQNGSEVSFVLF